MILYVLMALSITPAIAMAHCPLCSAATGMAVATARVYGVDDAIVGLFLGGFAVSTALWFNNIANKIKPKGIMPYQQMIFVMISILMTIATLYLAGLLDGSYEIFGMDKIFFGTVAGTAITLLSFEAHKALRKMNNSRNYVPMQGILLPLLFIAATSMGFYLAGWLI